MRKDGRIPWNSKCVPHRETMDQRMARYTPTEPDPDTGCILWTGPKNNGGYGVLMFTDWSKPYRERKGEGGKLAHRLAWAAVHGPIPAGAYICHHCDTPACINVEHLYLGDAKTNAADMSARGRYHKGPNWIRKEPPMPIVTLAIGRFF